MKMLNGIAALLLGFFICDFAHASEETLGAGLQDLLDYARGHNPEFAASRFESEAAAERLQPAGAWPDPVLRTELMGVVNRNSGGGANLLPSKVDGTRYLLMQRIPWFGKSDLQLGLAEAKAMQANVQSSATWSDLAGMIKFAYARYYYLAGSESLARETLSLLNSMEQIAQVRYANGAGTQQDVIRAQVEQTDLHAELLELENEQHHAHIKLNNLLSRPATALLAKPAQSRPLPAPAQLEYSMLVDRLRSRNPQLQIVEAGVQAAEKSRDLAYRNRYPDITLGVAPTQSGNSIKTWDLMVEFNIPFQQQSRRSEEREAEAMLAAYGARKETILNQVMSALSESVSGLETARQTETLIVTRLLPQAELTYQSALAGYETGKVDFATLLDAQKQILKAKRQQLKSQLEAQLRLADIERLLGEEI